jgi:hypothetical protein
MAITQAWKEGSTSVAQFMLQKITSELDLVSVLLVLTNVEGSDTELLFALKPQDVGNASCMIYAS